MTRAKTPQIGRSFIALHTAILTDYDLILAGNTARMVYPHLLALSASRGDNGLVTKDPRALNVVLQLDGGVAELEAAVAALAAAGKLEDAGDGEHWYLTEWTSTQADLGGSTTRSASSAASQLKRRHEEGKHAAEPRKSCQLCAEGVPSGSPVPAEVPQSETAPALEVVAEVPAGPASVPAKRGTSQLVSEFRGVFSDVLASMPRLDGYRQLMAAAQSLADANADLSKNVRGALMNAVLGDALEHYMGHVVAPKDFPQAFRGAKALSEGDGHWWWVLAAQECATRDFETSTGAVSYLKAVAASKRSVWLQGGAA